MTIDLAARVISSIVLAFVVSVQLFVKKTTKFIVLIKSSLKYKLNKYNTSHE